MVRAVAGRVVGWGLFLLVLALVACGLQRGLGGAAADQPPASAVEQPPASATALVVASDDSDSERDRVGSRWLSSVAGSGAALQESGAVGFASTPTPDPTSA